MLINSHHDNKVTDKSEKSKRRLYRNHRNKHEKLNRKHCQNHSNQITNFKSEQYHSLDFAVFYYYDVCSIVKDLLYHTCLNIFVKCQIMYGGS